MSGDHNMNQKTTVIHEQVFHSPNPPNLLMIQHEAERRCEMTSKDEALRMALEIVDEYVREHGYGKATLNAIKEALAQQQEMVQTEPNFEQRKQILDNLDRCLHRDSKHEFLRVWIRDWTNHKLSKQTPPPAKPWVGLTDEEIAVIAAACGGLASDFVVDVARAIEQAHGILVEEVGEAP